MKRNHDVTEGPTVTLLNLERVPLLVLQLIAVKEIS